MPVLIPATGVAGTEDWAHKLKAAFEEVGLPFEGRVAGPVFRPQNGETGPRKIRSKEVTRLLNFF